MENITPIYVHPPRNEQMGDTDAQLIIYHVDPVNGIILFLGSVMYKNLFAITFK